MLYISVNREDNLPEAIKEKAYCMMRNAISRYEEEHKCRLDICQLELDLRLLVSTANVERKPESTIDITIASCEPDGREILVCDEFVVSLDNPMYKVFKEYFMKRLRMALFE